MDTEEEERRVAEMSDTEKNLWSEKAKESLLCQFSIFLFVLGNIFICHKMQSDSPVVPEEIENEADWFLSANVMYKIGEFALRPDLYIIL